MFRNSILFLFLIPVSVGAQSAFDSSVAASSGTSGTEQQGSLTTQPPALKTDDRGPLSYVDFYGNKNDTGHMFITGFSLGYQFNRHVSVDARVPFYSVSATTTTTDSNTGTEVTTKTDDSGLGDPSFALQLRFPNTALNFRTRVTTWIPVASSTSGFTTGSALVDWTSQVSRPVGRLLPFGQVGIANTVPDTPLFILPYTAEGFNARLEAGTSVSLAKYLDTGASFYYVLPSGSQTIYSREYRGTGMGTGGMTGAKSGTIYAMANGSGNGSGSGTSNKFGYMTQYVTEDNDITRDHGVGAWLTARLPYFVDLQVGFTHSVDYDLDTFSFGVGFDPIHAFRRPQY